MPAAWRRRHVAKRPPAARNERCRPGYGRSGFAPFQLRGFAGPHYLFGRASASVARSGAYVGGIFDGTMGRRRADDYHHAPQGVHPSSRRRAPKRSRDDDRAHHAARRFSDDLPNRHRSRLSDRALRPLHGLSVRPARERDAGALRNRRRNRTRERVGPASIAGDDDRRRGVREETQSAGRSSAGWSGHDVSRVPQEDQGGEPAMTTEGPNPHTRFVQVALALAGVVVISAAGPAPRIQAQAAQARPRSAQPSPPAADVSVLKVRDNVYMLSGAGANITVQTFAQGVTVFDTGPAQNAD